MHVLGSPAGYGRTRKHHNADPARSSTKVFLTVTINLPIFSRNAYLACDKLPYHDKPRAWLI